MYYEFTLNLSQNQKQKLVKAFKQKTDVKIRLSYKNLLGRGGDKVLLTEEQITKINQAKQKQTGVDINFQKLNFKNKVPF